MIQQAPQTKCRPGYHNLCRPEILNLIPKGAKRILDLGCGTGELGRALKQRQECAVIGVELNTRAADEALKKLDAVVVADVNKYKPSPSAKPFDCLIFADILEHLQDPWKTLKRLTDWLTPDGLVVASIPNIAHPAVINQLQKGLFLYQPAGILDVSHLRFFTRTTIFQMFVRAGLKIKGINPFPAPTNPIQYLITASKTAGALTKPSTTILILNYDGLGYTQRCIQSIKENTRTPHKLIIIDNGSTDGTQKWLLERSDLYNINSDQNLGFAAGFNLGLDVVETPYFALVNNDVIVTDGWLSRMLKTIKSSKRVGIVGPTSNHVSGPQLDPGAKYTNLQGMNRHAQKVQQENQGKVQQFPRIVFFCTLFRSELIETVGLLDPIFGIGNFDDDDYCRRSLAKGYKHLIDRSVFIHHYGEVTFRAHGYNFERIMKNNLALYKQKWGIP